MMAQLLQVTWQQMAHGAVPSVVHKAGTHELSKHELRSQAKGSEEALGRLALAAPLLLESRDRQCEAQAGQGQSDPGLRTTISMCV